MLHMQNRCCPYFLHHGHWLLFSLKTSKFCLANGKPFVHHCVKLFAVAVSFPCINTFVLFFSVSVVCLFLYHLLVFVLVLYLFSTSSFDESGVFCFCINRVFHPTECSVCLIWLMLCDTIVQLVFALCPVFYFFLGWVGFVLLFPFSKYVIVCLSSCCSFLLIFSELSSSGSHFSV